MRRKKDFLISSDSKIFNSGMTIEKHESKLNKITSITEYNKAFIENIHEHYHKIAESLNKLVNNTEQMNKHLEKISKNGH